MSRTPDAFASLPSSFLFRPLSSRVARAGLRRVFSRARVSESRGTDERGDPEREGYLLGKGDTDALFSVVLEICLGVVAPRRTSCDRLHLTVVVAFVSPRFDLSVADATAFYRLPCFAGRRHRPVRTPRSCLSRWLPSLAPVSSPDDYTRLLGVSRRSWYQIVAYPGDFALLVFLLIKF